MDSHHEYIFREYLRAARPVFGVGMETTKSWSLLRAAQGLEWHWPMELSVMMEVFPAALSNTVALWSPWNVFSVTKAMS